MPVRLTQEAPTAWRQEALRKWPDPSTVFGISFNDNQAGSSILRPSLQWNWLAQPWWHAWHCPCSCWHGPVPGRNRHQCQAVMPSLPSGLLCCSRSGEWQKCKNCFSQLGSGCASTRNPGRLSTGCFQRLCPPCTMVLAGGWDGDNSRQAQLQHRCQATCE